MPSGSRHEEDVKKLSKRSFQAGATTVEYALVLAIVVAIVVAASRGMNVPLEQFFSCTVEKASSIIANGSGSGSSCSGINNTAEQTGLQKPDNTSQHVPTTQTNSSHDTAGNSPTNPQNSSPEFSSDQSGSGNSSQETSGTPANNQTPTNVTSQEPAPAGQKEEDDDALVEFSAKFETDKDGVDTKIETKPLLEGEIDFDIWENETTFSLAGIDGEAEVSVGEFTLSGEVASVGYDPETGDFTATLAKGEASFAVLEGDVSLEGEEGSTSASGEVLAVEGSGEAGITYQDGDASAGAKVKASAMLVEGDVEGSINITPRSIASLFGADLSDNWDIGILVGGSGNAGVGAKLEGKANIVYEDGKASAEIGAGLGLGPAAGLSVKIGIRIKPIVDLLKKLNPFG